MKLRKAVMHGWTCNHRWRVDAWLFRIVCIACHVEMQKGDEK
jgi:hypothetical protein